MVVTINAHDVTAPGELLIDFTSFVRSEPIVREEPSPLAGAR